MARLRNAAKKESKKAESRIGGQNLRKRFKFHFINQIGISGNRQTWAKITCQTHEPKKAMQAGARKYPAPPFPKQHQSKPGSESDLDPAPLYDAPFYRGSGKLEKKVALITGADSGIGRAVAILFAREGADVAVAYLNEHKDAR